MATQHFVPKLTITNTLCLVVDTIEGQSVHSQCLIDIDLTKPLVLCVKIFRQLLTKYNLGIIQTFHGNINSSTSFFSSCTNKYTILYIYICKELLESSERPYVSIINFITK